MAFMLPPTLLLSPFKARISSLSQKTSTIGLLRNLFSREQPSYAGLVGRPLGTLGRSRPPLDVKSCCRLSKQNSRQNIIARRQYQAPFVRLYTTSLPRRAKDAQRFPTQYQLEKKTTTSTSPQQSHAKREEEDPEADDPEPNYGYITLIPIVGACVVLHTGFQWALSLPKTATKDKVFLFYTNHFILSLKSLINGHWESILASAFFHASFPHLLFNMLAFVSFLPSMFTYYGAVGTLGISLLSQLGTAIGSTYWRALSLINALVDSDSNSNPEHRGLHDFFRRRTFLGKKPDPEVQPLEAVARGSSGISGVVCGWISAVAFKNPRSSIQVFFIFPMPIAAGAAAFAAYSWYALDSSNSIIDHPGHLGGLVAGLISAVFFRKYGSVPRLWKFFGR